MKVIIHLDHNGQKMGMIVEDLNHLIDILRFQVGENNKELNGELHINENKSRVHRESEDNASA